MTFFPSETDWNICIDESFIIIPGTRIKEANGVDELTSI